LQENKMLMMPDDRCERLFGLMLEAGLPGCMSGQYESLCRQAGMTEQEADNCLYDAFGMSGSEILHLMSECDMRIRR
jgi:hypothetical protein